MLLLGVQTYRNAVVLSDADPIYCKILGCYTLEISTDMGVAYRANSLVCYAHIFWENVKVSLRAKSKKPLNRNRNVKAR